MIFSTTDPRSAGLVATVGSIAYYVSGGAATQLYKYGTGDTAWCTIPATGPIGGAEAVTADPRTGAGLSRAIGARALYVAAQVGLNLYKFGPAATDWTTWQAAAVGAHTHTEAEVINLVTDLAAKQPLDADLTALAASPSTAGLVERTGAATYTTRLIGVANATDVLTRADADARYGLGDGVFGTGYDGDVTISGSTTLTREFAYNNLTIDAGVVLTVGRYPILVYGTLTNNGTIRSNGANGVNTGGSGAGGGAGAAGFLGVGSSGGGGGIGAGGSPGGTSTNQPSLTGSACVGGGGGAGTVGGGGAGGTITPLTTAGHPFVYSPAFGNFPYPSSAAVNGGTGGGGGGGNGAQAGGGGGGGGGIIVIKAKTIINNGAIEALGGVGGAGNTANCGGGGGGAGGKAFISTRSYTGTTPSVLAGVGGASGGGAGVAGATGNDGLVIQVAM